MRRWYVMAESDALSRQFDDVAQLYDQVRPRYPEAIVEHIITFAGLPADARIFEVGCGTGQITRPFAQRGYTVVAVDQGKQLADLAAQHCRPYPRVRVVPCTLEAWQAAPESYDVFLSAQAFHWIEPQYGLARAAELLKTGGTIALVWTLGRSLGQATPGAVLDRCGGHTTQRAGGGRSCRDEREVDGHLLRGDVGEARQTQGWDSHGDHSVALMAHHPR